MNRNLDGIYFRIKRNEKFDSICFSDLTKEERDKVMTGRSREWLKEVINILAETIKDIGEELDIIRIYEGEEE